MEVVYSTIIQLTLVSRVIAMSFENIIKSLPADIPGEFKNIMLDLYMKHPKEFDLPDSDLKGILGQTDLSVTPQDYRKKNTVVKKATAIKIKPAKKAAVKTKVPRKPNIMRSDTFPAPPPIKGMSSIPAGVTSAPPPVEFDKSVLPPPMMRPLPMPMPMPLPMPIYPRVPVLIPMKSFFEPVIHDHPPIYEIKDLIRNDEMKWKKKYPGKDSDTSLDKLSYSYDSVTDTDTSSDDLSSDYYDAFIRIKD